MSTLIVTLPSALDAGINFPKLGELRFKVDTLIANTLVRINLNVNASANISIIDSTSVTQFYDSTGLIAQGITAPLSSGVNTLYLKSTALGSFYLSIDNKFVLVQIGSDLLISSPSSPTTATTAVLGSLDLKDLKYVPYQKVFGTNSFIGDIKNVNKSVLTSFASSRTSTGGKVTGSIGVTTFNYPSLTTLVLNDNDTLTGSISSCNFSAVTNLNLSNTNIGGVLTNANLNSNVTILNLENTNIELDLGTLTTKNKVTSLMLSASKAYGNVAGLANMAIGSIASLRGLNLSGDLSQLNNATVFIANGTYGSTGKNNNHLLSTTFWSNKKVDRQYILAVENVRMVTGVDQFLIDMASLELHPNSVTGGSWLRTLNIRGTRTSASDAAVATLTGKGVTVNLIS